MPWRDMIQDCEFSPFKNFSLGVQERRAQSEHGGQTFMIGRTAMFDNSTSDTNEMAIFRFPKFSLGMLRFGCLEEWYFEELIKFVQLLFAWLIKDNQVDFGLSTLQIEAIECFTSYRVVWDPGDFTTYRSVRHRFA
jgi:hypothetical protein